MTGSNANVDGVYEYLDTVTAAWAPELPVYKHIEKPDIYFYWHEKMGWAIGKKPFEEERIFVEADTPPIISKYKGE